MKNVLVLSYEGNVRVEDAPQNASQDVIVEIARKALQDTKGEAITGLSNVEYMTESKMYDYISDMDDMGINVREDYIEVSFDEYK